MLGQQLEQIAETSEDAAVRAVAATCKEQWIYPVDSHVVDASGQLFGAAWVQDLMMMKRPSFVTREPFDFYGTMTDGYAKFLDDAFEAWLETADD